MELISDGNFISFPVKFIDEHAGGYLLFRNNECNVKKICFISVFIIIEEEALFLN